MKFWVGYFWNIFHTKEPFIIDRIKFHNQKLVLEMSEVDNGIAN